MFFFSSLLIYVGWIAYYYQFFIYIDMYCVPRVNIDDESILFL